MDSKLSQSYDHCRQVARTRARNFYYAFLLLPAEKRAALCAIYAFMRQCDDLVDDADNDSKARAQLSEFRKTLDEVLARESVGTELSSGANSFWPALVDTVKRYGIPPRHLHEVIDGAEMDLTTTRFQTFEDLRGYCYHVASAVGLVCVRIFGYKDESALKPAEDMGIAFQLTNILRDVKEDAGRGRIYLPLEDLAQFEVSESEILEGRWSDRLSRLIRFEADRAEGYYTKVEALYPLVDPGCRSALVAMARIYHGILRKIQKPRFNVLKRRARLTAPAKLGILAGARLSKAFGLTAGRS